MVNLKVGDVIIERLDSDDKDKITWKVSIKEPVNVTIINSEAHIIELPKKKNKA